MNSEEYIRAKHIFKFIDLNALSEKQVSLLESFEKQLKRKQYLTDYQMEILEDIYKRSKE